jgi:hypothetical protein
LTPDEKAEVRQELLNQHPRSNEILHDLVKANVAAPDQHLLKFTVTP